MTLQETQTGRVIGPVLKRSQDMNGNEEQRYCPKCGAEYNENHMTVFDGPRHCFQVICTVCNYKNEVPMGNKKTKQLIQEATSPWKPKHE